MSVPTFRLKRELFELSKQASFRLRPTYPVAPPDESRSGRFRGCLKSSRSANATGGPITFLSRFHPTSGQVLARGLGGSLFSERGWARHCSDAMATRRVSKAVGNFTACRRSAKVRLGKTSVAKTHALKKRTACSQRAGRHM